jgi:hypothetical protein
MAVKLSAFNPATQQLAVDVRQLLAGNDITVNQSGAQGCMSGGTDPECQAVFQALGIDWQTNGSGSGEPVDDGVSQNLFRAGAR